MVHTEADSGCPHQVCTTSKLILPSSADVLDSRFVVIGGAYALFTTALRIGAIFWFSIPCIRKTKRGGAPATIKRVWPKTAILSELGRMSESDKMTPCFY